MSEPDDRSAEFPDVEHPDPVEIPAEALVVPPPITERQSRLLNVIHDYREGKQDWDVTRSELVAFPYAEPPAPRGKPFGPGAGEWYSDVEAIKMGVAADDTWAQLQEAADSGMLTREEYAEVSTEIDERASVGS